MELMDIIGLSGIWVLGISVLVGGIGLGSIVGTFLLGQFRTILASAQDIALRLVFTRVATGADEANHVMAFLKAHAKRYPLSFGFAQLYIAHGHPLRAGGNAKVAFEFLGVTTVFLYHGAPYVYVRKDGNSCEGSFYCPRWRKWQRLAVDAVKWHNEQDTKHEHDRQKYTVINLVGRGTSKNGASGPPNNKPESPFPGLDVPMPISTMGYFWQPLNYATEELGLPVRDNSFEGLFYGSQVAQLIRQLRHWHTRKPWYVDRQVPWRRGVLLHGAPGTGKTSLVRAVCQDLDLPVYVFHIGTMSSHEFRSNWEEVSTMTEPRAVLFEDFDAVFHGRENVVTDHDLSFDTILNCLDGIRQNEGMLFFMTTNHIDHIDEAIKNRPGRIDVCLEMPPFDYDSRYALAMTFLQDEAASADLATTGDGMSPAQFKEICIQAALQQLWGESEKAPA